MAAAEAAALTPLEAAAAAASAAVREQVKAAGQVPGGLRGGARWVKGVCKVGWKAVEARCWVPT